MFGDHHTARSPRRRRPSIVCSFRALLVIVSTVALSGCGGSLADIEVPDVEIPDVEISIPEVDLPDVELSDVEVTDLTLVDGGESDETGSTGGADSQGADSDERASNADGAEPGAEASAGADLDAGAHGTDTAGSAELDGATDRIGTGGDPVFLGIVVVALLVLGAFVTLLARHRAGSRLAWVTRAKTVYLEGRWLADRLPEPTADVPGQGMIRDRMDSVVHAAHELELTAPNSQARGVVRDVADAIQRMESEFPGVEDPGEHRLKLLSSLDRLSELAGVGD